MPYARIFSIQPDILNAQKIEIETDISLGLYNFSIVGLADKSISESKERIISAIKHSGFDSPKTKNHKITVSLAPADIKKTGSLFDLAIAISYLVASGQIKNKKLEKNIFIGELALDGSVRKTKGVLPSLLFAKENNFENVFIPWENYDEATIVKGINIIPVKNLIGATKIFIGVKQKEVPEKTSKATQEKTEHGFYKIKGHEIAKRVLAICVAGKHNLGLIGPPGSGKTLLAKSILDIAPKLTEKQSVESSSIFSLFGNNVCLPITEPPFRTPHHTSSYASIVGGNNSVGEITLAHNGFLFLDEFTEFDLRTIEALREPLEKGKIFINRTNTRRELPSDFVLIAAMNPCPCGFLGSKKRRCVCTPSSIQKYRKKLSGPIVDRIDMWLEINSIESDTLLSHEKNNTETDYIQKIKTATEKQEKRYGELKYKNNGKISHENILNLIKIEEKNLFLLKEAEKKLHLSSRSIHKIIKVSQTIADIENSENITEKHLLEAISYRARN